MTNEKLKQILISILIGACVAFFSTLFQQLAEFFKAHAVDLLSGASTAMYYISKNTQG